MYVSSHDDEIQHVLINEIDVDKKHSNTMQQFVHKLVAAPTVSQSRNSTHIAKCFGPYMNSKVSNNLSRLTQLQLLLLAVIIIGYQNLAYH